MTGDPVLQFSKERHVMDRTPERLKKELEEELLLSLFQSWGEGQRITAETLP